MSFKFLSIVSFVCLSVVAYGQTGKIAGVVSDKKTGETLIGLSVKVKGGTIGASSNVQGKYIVSGLTTGKYTVDFSYIGFKTKSVSDVEVKDGEVTNLDVVMEESASQTLNAVVITTSARQESVNSLYAAQKNSSRISDGISADAIRKSPDRNTSDVLKRVSGTTIQDNKFVIIRGLSDRYNTAQLDNSNLPSTEPNRKAFSFDIVPSNLVDNIVISKTATPDMSGDFAGGSVKIITKDIPNENFVSFGIGYGYNTQSTFKDFKGSQRTFSDFLGFDDGSRALPENLPGTLSIINGLPQQQNIAAIKSLNQNYNITSFKALPSQNYQFSLGKVKDFEKSGNRLGTMISLTYRNSQQINPVQRQYFVFDYNDQQYKFSSSFGAVANFAYSFGGSKITFKNLYNRIFDDQFTSRAGTNSVTSTDNRFFAFDLIEKSLIKSTLDGEHKLGDKGARIRWTAGYSNIVNDQPDQRKTNYSRNISDRGNPSIGYSANVISLGKENTRLFSKLNENSFAGDLNYTRPVKMFGKSSIFKTGLSSQYRDRSFDVRFLGLLLNPNTPGANEIRERSLNTLFGSDLVDANAYKLDEIGNAADRYNGDALTNAAYLMLDNKFGEKTRLVWGVRAEQFMLNLTTYDPSKPAVKLDNIDILPSANLTYAVTPKANFRLSYYRTLARPEFRELAPFAYYDYEMLATQQGNPALQRATIDNADIRYEMYPSPGQIISVSAFYKKFENAIESYINDINSTPDISYFNADKANTFGVEFEFRKSLSFLGKGAGLERTTLYTNVSLIKSEVTDPALLGISRPMVGQSPYVVNAGISHTALNDKFSLNLLYNRIGRRIYKANGSVFPSVWENPRDVVDFQLAYKLFKNNGEIKLNATDLLNQNNVFYFDYDTNKKYSEPGDEIISRYKPGRTFSLAFTYTIK